MVYKCLHQIVSLQNLPAIPHSPWSKGQSSWMARGPYISWIAMTSLTSPLVSWSILKNYQTHPTLVSLRWPDVFISYEFSFRCKLLSEILLLSRCVRLCGRFGEAGWLTHRRSEKGASPLESEALAPLSAQRPVLEKRRHEKVSMALREASLIREETPERAGVRTVWTQHSPQQQVPQQTGMLPTQRVAGRGKVSSFVKRPCVIAESRPTLCNPVDCSLPGSSVHGALQARTLEGVAMPSSRESSQPRDWTRSPELRVDSLLSETPGKPPHPPPKNTVDKHYL